MATDDVEAATKHNVFNDPELLTKLFIHQADIGYRLATFYTACTTIYVALVGVAAQYYFSLVPKNREAAWRVAVFGCVVSVVALLAPIGLEASCRQIAAAADRYAEALGLPREKFTVVRFGAALSFVAFVMITIAWVLLIRMAR